MKLSRQMKVAAAVVAVVVLHGILLVFYKHLDHLARHVRVHALEVVLEEATGTVTGLLIIPPCVWFVRRFRPTRARFFRVLPIHVAWMFATSAAHTWMIAESRAILFPAFGFGAYDYGDMRVRYWMEGAHDTIMYLMLVTAVMAYDALEAARAREIAQAELRAELARAQVKSLERRLHPHFLFNALNTISAVMYDDPRAADRMIAGLSSLLRRALDTGDAQEVPLAEELAMLENYLEIMRARFEDKLDVAVEVDADAASAMVPPLLLQPIVENAIHHGADPESHLVRARLRVQREGNALRLEVRDHGRGTGGGKPKEGVGLATTATRLSTLYGEAQRLAFEDAEGGGLRVTIEIPFKTRLVAAAEGA